MHVDREYCTECRCYHPRNMDIAGSCFSAEAWRTMHFDEEDRSEPAWEEFARNIIFYQDTLSMPMFNTVHGCGCTTITHDNLKLEWCYECQRRRESERYDD